METENNRVIHSSFWANFFKTPADKLDLQKSLSSIPIFKDLTKKDFALLFDIIHNRSYVAGEYIFYQGDPGIGIYIVREGEVKVHRKYDNGELLPLATLGKGDFFGELALVDGEKRPASAVAGTDCRVAVIFKPDLDDFIEKYPKKGIKILNGISQIVAIRLRKLNEDHMTLLNKFKINGEEHYGT